MIAVLTGDIVGSSYQDKTKWIPALKSALQLYGQEGKDWEVYRGDEFQLRLTVPQDALSAAFLIKARLIAQADTHIRIAMGIGPGEAQDNSQPPFTTPLTESGGPAFILSGRKLDEIKNRRIHLAVASENEAWDKNWNLLLQWVLVTADNWSQGSAEIVDLCLVHPELSQTEMAAQLNIAQSAISQRLKRSGFDLLDQTIQLFKEKMNTLWKP
ncbi:SatD family (SatD) [Arachidicoccus rhizosphaerae]|jgi:hypothetical protein|uniref:SatD family (SatD) n=1 Tax=Arachidicoccus rhizosphaerae TaxID=551991 RepID=A0A1H4AZ30_9BACT|nr:SatD family protein [Arachidicoccus rhizosphaerae]SEA41084.1 SatD family (SatD) [Arachidicoccus rhizosphaerae]